MDNSCSSVAKCLLVFAGLCYLASAGGLSYVGIWAFSMYDHFDEIVDATITVLPAGIILGASAVMCIISLLAFISAFKNNKLLLAVFFCLVLVVLVAEVVASLLGLLYQSEVEDVLTVNLVDALNKYNVTAYHQQIDYMQEQFECCGVLSASDWEQSTDWAQNHTGTVPTSCCNATISVHCNATLHSDNIYQQGCLAKLSDEFDNNLVSLASAVILLAVVQILGLISTCVLVCRTRGEHHHYEFLIEEIGGGLRT